MVLAILEERYPKLLGADFTASTSWLNKLMLEQMQLLVQSGHQAHLHAMCLALLEYGKICPLLAWTPCSACAHIMNVSPVKLLWHALLLKAIGQKCQISAVVLLPLS